MTVISSRDNSLVKAYTGLREQKSRRRQERRFVIEGARLALDAVESGTGLFAVFLTDGGRARYGAACEALEKSGAPCYSVTSSVAAALSDTKTPQGIFCIAQMREETLSPDAMSPGRFYLALEDLQDPGNLGTILRTAEAVGIDGVLLSDGCADLYSPKTVRASMGAVFRLPVRTGLTLPQTLGALGARGLLTCAAVLRDGESLLTQDFSKGAVAVIGNEGNGLSDAAVAACARRVTIPMRGRAESLNAAAAATILLWEMTRGI